MNVTPRIATRKMIFSNLYVFIQSVMSVMAHNVRRYVPVAPPAGGRWRAAPRTERSGRKFSRHRKAMTYTDLLPPVLFSLVAG